MIASMSQKLSSFFVKSGIIQSEEREVYDYGMQLVLSTVFSFLAVIIIAIVAQRILETAFYLIGFLPLRTMAGGYHARTHRNCFLILMATYALYLTILFVTPAGWMFPLAAGAAALAVLLIFLLSPVADKNKPVTENETKVFQRKSRIAVMVYFALTIAVGLLLNNTIYAFSLSLGMVSVALSLVAALIRNQITKEAC